jgi:type II secretory pathway pseudopilin PulG
MRPSRTRSGLTVVEVIVVIFVIAILVGLVLPGIRANKEGEPPEMINLNNLVVALKAFYTDYGRYPIDPAVSRKADAVYGYPGWSHHNSEVVNVLRADGTDPGPNFRNALNPQQVVYLDVPYVRDLTNPRTGLGTGKETNSYGVTTPGEWYDPWGSPYIVIIDANGDGVCNLGKFYSDVPSPHTGVAGVSFGADKMIGTKGDRKYAGSDDVMTWIGR